MAASSVGSDVFALLSLAFISALILLLLRHFLPLRTTPAYLLVPVFLALALPVSIILLVPIDLASSSRTHGVDLRGIWLPEKVVLVVWRIAYWLTFALTWIILPLLGEYADSGFRTPKDRILYSVRSNGRYQLIVLVCGTLGLIYVFLTHGFEGTSVKALIMALAYCWGLIQTIYLMGHGLVAVPRRLIRNANNGNRLRRVQTQAPKTHDRLNDAVIELNELELQVQELQQRKHGISRDHQEWIEDLADLSSLIGSLPSHSIGVSNTSAKLPGVITDRYLAELSRKLNRARHKRIRFMNEWARIVKDATDIQAIIDASASRRLDFSKPSPDSSISERFTILSPYSRYFVHVRLIPYTRIFFGCLFSVASVCIVWSELIKIVAPKLSIISLTVIYHGDSENGKVGFAGQVIASAWILYMATATLASFDDVKVWGNRALVPRNTYGESACWYAGQIAKLTVPLAYNFVTFLPKSVRQDTTFYHFLGRLIVLTPLGKGFDYFFPIFILVPVCATLFNLYGKAKRVFGFGIVEDDVEEGQSAFATGGWREGRELIEQELNGTSDLRLLTHSVRTSSPVPSDNNGRSGSINRPGQRLRPSNASPRAPRLYIPPAERIDTAQLQAQRLSEATRAAEEEDESAFSGFAHRVRNTIDRVERPDWLPDIGKRPKWMGGADNNQEGSGRAEAGRGFGRWFGGRPVDGRVRL